MDLVTVATLCALHGSPLLTPCPVPSQHTAQAAPSPALSHVDLTPWRAEIAAAAQRFGVPKSWIGAVIAAESGGHTSWHGAPIVSSAGAMGLMQLMPKTYRAMRGRYGLGADPFDPQDNILAGTAYLRRLYQRYGYPDLFAAYHAGPGRLEAWLDGRKALPASTRAYLERLVPGSDLAFETDSRDRAFDPGTSRGKGQKTASQDQTGGLFFMRGSASDARNSTAEAADPRHESGHNSASSARVSPRAVFVPLSHPQR